MKVLDKTDLPNYEAGMNKRVYAAHAGIAALIVGSASLQAVAYTPSETEDQTTFRYLLDVPQSAEGSETKGVVKFPRRQSGTIECKFNELAARWKKETSLFSSDSQIILNQAYQQIIGMGLEVVPYILEDLRQTNAPWYWALMAITSEDPIKPEIYGNAAQMTKAWLEYATKRGLA